MKLRYVMRPIPDSTRMEKVLQYRRESYYHEQAMVNITPDWIDVRVEEENDRP